MLSRVSYAATTCDEAIKQYDFALATSTCYNLWLYDLCDIYLVSNSFLIHDTLDMKKKKIVIQFARLGIPQTNIPK